MILTWRRSPRYYKDCMKCDRRHSRCCEDPYSRWMRDKNTQEIQLRKSDQVVFSPRFVIAINLMLILQAILSRLDQLTYPQHAWDWRDDTHIHIPPDLSKLFHETGMFLTIPNAASSFRRCVLPKSASHLSVFLTIMTMPSARERDACQKRHFVDTSACFLSSYM